MKVRAEIMALPERDRLAAALDLIDELTGQGEVEILAIMRRFGLSPKEAAILSFLNARAGRVCSRDAIFTHVWGDCDVDSKIVDVYLSRIRPALPDRDLIENKWGIGWTLRAALDLSGDARAGDVQVAA